ncbi:telomere length regulation protein TEL2 homolog isoform X2 [Palaemon carinicauda]
MVMNYTEVEAKVREATNDEAWGPTGPQMQELAQSTFYYEQFPEVMGMLWKRMLQDNRSAWRRTYKSLLLLNYLVRNGSERVVTSAREHIYDLRTLENFKFVDEQGKDQGLNIRMKAKDLIDFIQDDNRLREERKKAKKNKDKYVGVSSDSLGFRGSSQGDWDDWGSSRRKQEDLDVGGGNRFEDSPNASGDEVEDAVDPVNEYRDDDASPKHNSTSIPSGIGKVTVPPKKSSKPSKMVDLGAAATFGKEATKVQTTASKVPAKTDLLDDLFGNQTSNGTSSPTKAPHVVEDDFDPRAGEAGGGPKEADFGDFNTAFGNNLNASSGNDDFADFSSFTQNTPVQPSGGSSNASLLIGMTPSPAAPASSITPVVSAPAASAPVNSNMDLLDGLLGGGGSVPTSNTTLSSHSGATNTDLLGGIGYLTPSPSAAAPIIPMSPMQVATADVDEPERRVNTSNRDDEKESKAQLNQKPERSHVAASLAEQKRLLKILEMELAKCPPDFKIVRTTLESMLFLLPGEFTPQRYAGTDTTNEGAAIFFQYTYGQVLNILVKNYINDGILRKNLLCKNILFDFLEKGYLEESINCLISIAYKADMHKLKLIVELLEKLIKSNCLLSFLLRYCSQFVDVKGESILFDETVRLYVSLPDRIANKLERDSPDFLMPQMFCKIMSYYLLQAIYFVADGLRNDVSGKAEPIAKIFGKICLVSDTEAVLTTMVRWLKVWGMKDLIVQRVVHKIFTHVPDVACERIITTLIKMEVDDATFYMLLGDCGIKNPKLKYLFTQKFLITRHLPHAFSVPTIIRYLGRAQCSHEVLRIVFQQLLDTWSDKSIMAHNSFEHHVHITRGILTSVAVFTNTDVELCRSAAIQMLLHGVANHLDAPNHQSKLIGMITAEELTKVFNAGGPVLKFDYKDCELTMELKNLVTLSENNKPLYKDDYEKNLEKEWIEDFESELINVGILNSDNFSKEIKPIQIEESSPSSGKSGICAKIEVMNISANTISKQDNDSDDLDSDDDEFQPYDMSNDTKQIKVKEPSYPQEILDYMIEGEAEKVEAALRVSEKVIRQEIKNQDSDLAVEMTKVLLHLENKYDIEGFEDNRLSTLAALTSSHPKQCALYLGVEFYERNYNMRQRLDILQALSRSAVELSGDGVGKSCDLTPSGSKKKKVLYKSNLMKEVAGCFFYPLMNGLSYVQPHLDLLGCDRFLLCDVLKTLGLIVGVTGQCELSLKMAGCLLELTWPLRTHEDSDVRAACLEALSSGLEVVPDSLLLTLVPGEVVELRQWLGMTLEKDKDKKCQLLAMKLALKLDKCFKEQIGICQ